MSVVALTQSSTFAKALKAYCDAAGFSLVVFKELGQNAASLSRVTDVLILHADHVDGGTINLLEQALRIGFENVFVISVQPVRVEWEERAYLAGAQLVAAEPMREKVLFARIRRVVSTRRRPEQVAKPVVESAALAPASGQERAPTLGLGASRVMLKLLQHAHSADLFSDAFLQHVSDHLAVSRLALYLTTADANDRNLKCVFAVGVDADAFKHVALSLDAGIGKFLRQRGTVLVNGRLDADAQTEYEINALGAQVAIPVSDRASLVGILLLGRHITGEDLRREEIETVFHLMGDLALVLRNARVNQQLSEERAFFSMVLEQMAIGSMVMDLQLRVVHWTTRFAEAIEHDPEAALRLEHLPQVVASAVYDIVNERRPGPCVMTYRNSRSRVFRLTIQRFSGAMANNAAVLVLTQDFTEVESSRRESESAVKAELLSRISSNFGHVVRNSLTHISTFAQLIPAKHADAAFIREFSNQIPGDLTRVLHTIDQLEWLNRDCGVGTEINITERANRVWRHVTQKRAKGAVPQLVVNVPDVAVFCAEDAFDAIFFELLSNAVQSTGVGRVEVTADEPTSTNITLHIHDDGEGIAEQLRAQVLEPFFTTRNMGVGLGLSVAERIVKSYNGELSVKESPRLKGAEIVFSLPISQ